VVLFDAFNLCLIITFHSFDFFQVIVFEFLEVTFVSLRLPFDLPLVLVFLILYDLLSLKCKPLEFLSGMIFGDRNIVARLLLVLLPDRCQLVLELL